MRLEMKRSRISKISILIVAVTTICWDIAVSTLSVEPGTFRFESEFDAVTGTTAMVGLVTSDYTELSDPVARNINPTYDQIEEMVGKAIELQGGFRWVLEKGDKVMIKVNLVGGDNPSGDGNNTDVRVVKALMKHIHAYTGGDVEIQVAEGTARSNDDPYDPNSVWGNSGYLDLITDPEMSGINFSLLNLNQSFNDLIEIDLGSEGMSTPQGTKYYVHRAEVEADVYIAVPVLKIHNTGITNALKLQIGTAPGCYYGYNKSSGTDLYPEGIHHDIGHRVWTTEAIVDLCNIADIDFVVVDAIMCLETVKTNRGNNQVRFNTVLAGADPVAIDHVSAKLMYVNPDDIAHITLAEKIGLGTNNPAQIIVEGVSIEEARKKVKKSQSQDGKFGQSNRTWILSNVFEGTDITEEFIAGEASFEPVPGEDGWSQPVYFFDDRIDLFSYYSGMTGMVSYAFTYFDALEDRQAELWLGTHEAIIIYLNGVQVYSFTSTTSYGDSDRGENVKLIDIQEGRNTLMVKTLNNFGDYSFALNICEVESDPLYSGARVPGLKFHTDENWTRPTSVIGPSVESDVTTSLRCYPNPAREYVSIEFNLAEPGQTSVEIIDMEGKVVKSLRNERLSAGQHHILWSLDADGGGSISNGVYICSLISGSRRTGVKIVVE